jgi:uncharacterized membrane protein
MLSVIIGAVALNLYAIVLVVVRAVVYRTSLYRPMLWNIWLSVAPIVILLVAVAAWGASLLVSRPLAYAVLTVFGLVWLLMLPNASYLITELNLSHRGEGDPVPLWYDIILVITLAMSGVVNTVLNVFTAHLLVVISWYDDAAANFLRPAVLVAVCGVMLLLSFGMYLGRYPRFNSWDVRHPASFARKLRDHFAEKGNLLACFGFTLTYAVFLALLYLVIAGPVIESLLGMESLRARLAS